VQVRKSEIRKFLMINPLIGNPQISLVSQSANLQEKISVSDLDPHWSASNIYILSPQIGGFAIFRTYFRTAQLWLKDT
jgi:hypothetical protein